MVNQFFHHYIYTRNASNGYGNKKLPNLVKIPNRSITIGVLAKNCPISSSCINFVDKAETVPGSILSSEKEERKN